MRLSLRTAAGALLLFAAAYLAKVEGKEMRITDLNKLAQPGEYRAMVRVDDFDRKFIFCTPTALEPDERYPIVFFLHGAGGSAEQAARTYGWIEKAETEKFYVVFPEGLGVAPDKPGSFALNPNIWRDGRSDIPNLVDDVDFFDSLLNKLEACLSIDPRRIYVAGFSNGAAMTFTLGARFSDRIAAIAPISSQSFVQVESLPRPLPIYYLTGTADPLIPFHGGTTQMPWGGKRTLPAVQETVDHWVRLDGCPPQPKVIEDKDGVRVLRYGPGNRKAEVLFTTIQGNGHHYPGTVEPLPALLSGPTLDPFHATNRIWDFFQRHRL